MRRLKPHLTYANVAATVALIIAVAGGTTAIAGSKAGKNTVASSSIKPYNVTARDLAGIRVVEVDGQFSAFAAASGVNACRSRAPFRRAFRRSGFASWRKRMVCAAREGPDTLMAAYALCLKAKPGK